jgi:hypothetical protein
MSFGKSEFDAKGFAEFGKGVEEVRYVGIGEGSRGVVDDGGGVGLGAKSVIVRQLKVEPLEFRTFEEFGVDLFQDEYGYSKG